MVEEYRIEQMPELINKIKTAIDSAEGVPVTKTATGNQIEITDGAAEPLVKCVTQITGYQSGTGTPSPDNVRPIVAYTEGEIEVRGNNMLPSDAVYSGGINIYTGESESGNNGVTGPIFVRQNETYTLSNLESANYNVRVFEYDRNQNFINTFVSPAGTNTYTTFIVGANTNYVRFKAASQKLIPNNPYMLEKGSTATTYEPYTSTTHTTTYPSAIYHGIADLINKKITYDWGYIASYDGEELPGEWISSMDVYEEGTAPTTGANVAYALAEPITEDIAISDYPIKSLYGYNHIESTTGDLDIEYYTYKFQPLIDLVSDIAADAGQVVYSTTERVIGTWTDGSIVYEKTIVSEQTLSDTWANYAATTGMDVIVSVEPRYTRDSEEVPGSFSGTEMASWIHREGYIKVCTPTDSSDWKIESMTIRYTKSAS